MLERALGRSVNAEPMWDTSTVLYGATTIGRHRRPRHPQAAVAIE
jgi:hypothetical protein